MSCLDSLVPMNRSGFPGGDLACLRGDQRVLKRGVVSVLGFGWRDVADGFEQAALLSQSTHSSVVNSTASPLLHGLRRWITSALQRPLIVSASALS